ncbi:MAG: dUTP diphosphatase, partial [Patescibacteria group bacterium]
VGLVWDKSGLALNNGIKTMAGVIDSGYRGEIKIVLINLGDEDFEIKKGQKIAQMLVQKVERPEIELVDELNATERGGNGFGSTGLT